MPSADLLRKVKIARDMAAAMEDIARIGAHAYANGYDTMPAIVVRHFTPGNAARQGWAPLSAAYAARKAAGLATNRKGAVAGLQTLKTGQRVKADKAAPHVGGAGANLPLLVLTGRLRAAVQAGGHRVTSSRSVATVTFAGLPNYAEYLQDGSGKMPKRSPVDISPDDRRLILAVMMRVIRGRITGEGGKVAVGVEPGAMPRQA